MACFMQLYSRGIVPCASFPLANARYVKKLNQERRKAVLRFHIFESAVVLLPVVVWQLLLKRTTCVGGSQDVV